MLHKSGNSTIRSAKTSKCPRYNLPIRHKPGNIKQIIIVALSCAGDIETQPGPTSRNNIANKKRKYSVKFPCQKCQKGVRSRLISCKSCKSISHPKCINGITNIIYDNLSANNEQIIFTCKFCASTSDSNFSDESFEIIKETLAPSSPSFPSLLPATGTPEVSGDNTTNLQQPDPVIPTTGIQQQTNPDLPTNATQQKNTSEMICKYCQLQVKSKNIKRLCGKCKSIFHPRCYKKVCKDDQLCVICISKELPYYSENELSDNNLINDLPIQEETLINDNIPTQGENLLNPSQMPDNMFECFNRRGLHFIHINARSVFHKLHEIRALALKIKPAVICISETWLDPSATKKSIEIDNYNVERNDRTTRCGGVCAYIRSDLSYNHKVELQNNDLEDLWLELLLPNTKPIYIGTCYRAPNNNNIIECLESTLSKLRPDCETLILGDFNICLLNKKTSLTKKFIDILKSYNFTQLIDSPTRVTQTTSSLIDHIHTNNRDKICQSGVIVTGLSDHYITYCTRKTVKGQINKHNTITIRSMKNYTEDRFIEKLQSMDWSIVLNCIDVNVAWEKFKAMFTLAIDEIAPEKDIRIKYRTEPWINEEILELIHARDRALLESNKNKTDVELRKVYSKLRNKLTRLIRQTKANFFQNKVDEHKDNPKMLWKQFKTLGYCNKNKDKSRTVLEIDNEKCFDSKKVANHMNNFYLTIASTLQSQINNMHNIFDTSSQIFKNFYINKGIIPKSFNISQVSEDFVYRELCKLNPNKSTGIDGIKSKFLKDGANVIKSVITHIVNLSIETETVPDELKSAIVKPLFKKNSRLEAGNYRPVSILCIVSKILERAIYVQVQDYLKDNKLLYEFQSGFRKSYSTDTCLINLMDHIRTLTSKGNYVGMVLLDLQKAFDTVDHEILCNKLEAMGINFTKWFQSYLGGRQQIVVANGINSEPGTVNCGVPQGSILGPLLFLCYVNDMSISLKCKLLLYADDSALIVSGSDPQSIADILSKELESCRQWLMDNKLSLHLGKTESILFASKRKLKRIESFDVKCGNETIKHVNSVKYLGLQIDNDLAGNSIVDEIVKKVNSRLRFLYRYKDLLNFESRKTLCSALIQCHFDYSCSSWYPGINKGLQNKLQVAQNRTVRFILKLDNRSHIGNTELEKAGFLKVPDRVKQLKLGHVFKIKKKTCPFYLSTNFLSLNENETRVNTRAKANNFDKPRICTNTFAYSAIDDWNTLPNNVKGIKSENKFKESIKKTLIADARKDDMNPFVYY